ncbi:MAG: TIGR01777 family oxidoreductase [Candidatus Pedobacter colombiensis]|uniref:TIGR01777 family oxidoreductase n=1 Tax=Candidatus Pedobacter colombiensis TaxID=3121371 RepID=A0AAJ6B6T5_9SPHI|nr:TIGR01777 family oxidoreductase [Pedobacter sp.]WEK18811.1 MAG: TIGR01777 family oxidoreductase [Pedobacter sp.]
MNKRILITGATGMIGKKLINALRESGHTVSILSRKQRNIPGVQVFLWDVYSGRIDKDCMIGIDTVIHLAGENISKYRWSNKRKQQIIDSRVLSTQLLYKAIKEHHADVDTFIAASASGYYGDCGDEILTEDSPAGFGFLAQCCKQWEDAVDKGKYLGLRIVKFRTGIILAKGEGALTSFEKPIKFFLGAPLGTGKQWIPWIHVDDVISAYKNAVESPLMAGAYNACAPFPVTNATLTKAIARKLLRPVWPFNIPEKILRILLGEMSEVIFTSSNTSAQKLLSADFKFKYTQLMDALSDIYG